MIYIIYIYIISIKIHTIIFIVPSPSTIIVAFDIPKPSLEQFTKERLFLDVILLMVMLAGLADGDLSGVLTCGKEVGNPTLAVKLLLLP